MTGRLSPQKEFAFERVSGLWIAIPTPFVEESLAIDEQALRDSVEHYVSGVEVDGIFCGGVMGEFWALTVPERRRVHELVTDTVAGRIPVMAQTSHHTFDHTVELTRHAEEIGMDFAIVMNPYFPPNPSDELVVAWYEALAARAGIPTFLFNTSYSGYSISPQLIERLAQIPAVCGIKNPKPHEHLMAVQESVGDQIVVCDAAEDDWLDLHLNHGFRALMSTPALAMFQTAASRPIQEYTRLADAGRLEEAWALHATLEPHRRAFQRWMRDPWITNKGGAVPIAQLKRWLDLMGMPQGPVRLPLIPLDPAVDAELAADVAGLGLVAGR
jgi:4-hydroxy-tetrahydrodipicolinate synthase